MNMAFTHCVNAAGNYFFYNIFRQSQQMEQGKQLKLIISQVLIAKGFYYLNYKSLGDILRLLGKEITWSPAVIQELAIQGLTQAALNQQKYTEGFFFRPEFQSIESGPKNFLCNIIQEIISAKHRLQRTNSQETMTRAIAQINFPLLTFSGYTPQIGFMNRNNCLNPPALNNGRILYQQPQIALAFNPIYHENPIQQQSNALIQDKHEQIQPVNQKKQNDQKKRQDFISQAENVFKIQNIQNNGCQILYLAVEPQKNKCQEQKEDTIKNQKSKIQQIIPSQKIQISQLQQRPKDVNHQKQKTFDSIQIQTGLSLIQYGLKRIKPTTFDQQKRQSFEKKQVKQYIQKRCQSNQSQHLVYQYLLEQQIYGKKQNEKGISFQSLSKNQEVDNQPLINQQSQKFSHIASQDNDELNYQNKLVQQIHLEAHSFHPENNFESNLISFNEGERIELLQINHQYNTSPNKLQYCVCKGSLQSLNIFMCEACLASFHLQCLEDKQQALFFKVECPICKIRSVDPFQKVKNVIGQFYMKDIDITDFSATINLSPYVHLKQNKSNNKKFIKQRQNDLEIRCLKIEKHYERSEITWPDQVVISVNGSKLTETYGLLLNSMIKKRVDRSLVITQQALTMNDDSQEQDLSNVTINIQLKSLSAQDLSRKQIDNCHTYILGVYLIQRIKLNEVYKKIVDNIEPFQHNYIKKLFSNVLDNSQIVIDFMTCRVRDPYSASMIDYPVRGTNCQHLQCFDLKTYLYLIWGSKNQLWRCPVCSKQAKMFKLDSQQLQMIKKLKKMKATPQEIVYLEKGDLILKLEVDKNKRIIQTDYQFKNQQKEVQKKWLMQVHDDQCFQNNRQQQKIADYAHFQYFPKVQLMEVLFTGKDCFNKPKISKNKKVKKAEKEKPKRKTRKNKQKE